MFLRHLDQRPHPNLLLHRMRLKVKARTFLDFILFFSKIFKLFSHSWATYLNLSLIVSCRAVLRNLGGPGLIQKGAPYLRLSELYIIDREHFLLIGRTWICSLCLLYYVQWRESSGAPWNWGLRLQPLKPLPWYGTGLLVCLRPNLKARTKWSIIGGPRRMPNIWTVVMTPSEDFKLVN